MMMIFHAGAVDSSSVTSHDSGTNIDLCALPASSVSSIFAEEDFVYIYFKDAGRFEGGPVGSATEVIEQTRVRLTVGEGTEFTVVKNLAAAIVNRDRPALLFDAVNSSYSIRQVSGVQIVRTDKTHTIASD